MEKKEKHLKAQDFRDRILMPAQRKRAIYELLSKKEYSETDRIYLPILFQKTSYITGCECEYRLLIDKLKSFKELGLDNKIAHFKSKL